MATFDNVLPRNDKTEKHLLGLGTRLWPFHLAALYLLSGRFMPDDAKRVGVSFGFCDAEGAQVPEAGATCVGWRVGARAAEEDETQGQGE